MESVASTMKVFIEECDIATFEPFNSAARRAQPITTRVAATSSATARGEEADRAQNSFQSAASDGPLAHRKTPRRVVSSVSSLDASPNSDRSQALRCARPLIVRQRGDQHEQLAAGGARGAARRVARRRGEFGREHLDCSGTLLVFDELLVIGRGEHEDEDEAMDEENLSYDSLDEGDESHEEVEFKEDHRGPRPPATYRVIHRKDPTGGQRSKWRFLKYGARGTQERVYMSPRDEAEYVRARGARGAQAVRRRAPNLHAESAEELSSRRYTPPRMAVVGGASRRSRLSQSHGLVYEEISEPDSGHVPVGDHLRKSSMFMRGNEELVEQNAEPYWREQMASNSEREEERVDEQEPEESGRSLPISFSRLRRGGRASNSGPQYVRSRRVPLRAPSSQQEESFEEELLVDDDRVLRRRTVAPGRLLQANEHYAEDEPRRAVRRSRQEQIVVDERGEDGHELQEGNEEELDVDEEEIEEQQEERKPKGLQLRLPIPSRKLSERTGLREGGIGGSSLGTLSTSTRSLSARSLSSPHAGMIVGAGVGSGVGGPSRKGSRPSYLTPGSRCDSYLDASPLEESALNRGRGHGPRQPRQAHSSAELGLGDEPAEGEEEPESALTQLRSIGGGSGRGGRARPLRRSQGLLVAVPAGSPGSTGRLSREDLLSPAGTIAEDAEDLSNQNPEQPMYTWPRSRGHPSSLAYQERKRSSPLSRAQPIAGLGGQDTFEPEEVDAQGEFELVRDAEENVENYRVHGSASRPTRVSSQRRALCNSPSVDSVQKFGTDENPADAPEEAIANRDPNGVRVGGPIETQGERSCTRTSAASSGRGTRVSRSAAADGEFKFEEVGEGGEAAAEGELVSLSSGGRSGGGRGAHQTKASQRSRGAMPDVEVEGDGEGEEAVELPQLVEGGGGAEGEGECGPLEQTTGGEESTQESEQASPPATARSVDSGYGPPRKPQAPQQQTHSPRHELSAGAHKRSTAAIESEQAGNRAVTGGKWSSAVGGEGVCVGVLASSATDERFSQAGEQLDDLEKPSNTSNRLHGWDMASGAEESEARERPLHGWQKDEQAFGRREAENIGSLTETSIADSAQQTSGASGVAGASGAAGAGLCSLELLKALVGGGLAAAGEADGSDGRGKSTGARVSTLSIEAEEAVRVPRVAQLLPTTHSNEHLEASGSSEMSEMSLELSQFGEADGASGAVKWCLGAREDRERLACAPSTTLSDRESVVSVEQLSFAGRPALLEMPQEERLEANDVKVARELAARVQQDVLFGGPTPLHEDITEETLTPSLVQVVRESSSKDTHQTLDSRGEFGALVPMQSKARLHSGTERAAALFSEEFAAAIFTQSSQELSSHLSVSMARKSLVQTPLCESRLQLDFAQSTLLSELPHPLRPTAFVEMEAPNYSCATTLDAVHVLTLNALSKARSEVLASGAERTTHMAHTGRSNLKTHARKRAKNKFSIGAQTTDTEIGVEVPGGGTLLYDLMDLDLSRNDVSVELTEMKLHYCMAHNETLLRAIATPSSSDASDESDSEEGAYRGHRRQRQASEDRYVEREWDGPEAETEFGGEQQRRLALDEERECDDTVRQIIQQGIAVEAVGVTSIRDREESDSDPELSAAIAASAHADVDARGEDESILEQPLPSLPLCASVAGSTTNLSNFSTCTAAALSSASASAAVSVGHSLSANRDRAAAVEGRGAARTERIVLQTTALELAHAHVSAELAEVAIIQNMGRTDALLGALSDEDDDIF